jgi:hypothetical protein
VGGLEAFNEVAAFVDEPYRFSYLVHSNFNAVNAQTPIKPIKFRETTLSLEDLTRLLVPLLLFYHLCAL